LSVYFAVAPIECVSGIPMPSPGLCHVPFSLHFQLVKGAVPTTVEVEDRHIEHEHWVVPSLAATKYFPPPDREVSSITINFSF